MSDDDTHFDDIDDEEYRDREGDPFAHLDADDPGSDPENEDALENADVPENADDFGTVDGPRSDPFEYLGAADSPGSTGETPDERDAERASRRDDPATADESRDVSRGSESATDVDVSGDPLGDVDVSRGDPFESGENPFERVDVDGVDPDEVWDRFTAEAGSAVADAESAGADAGSTAADDGSATVDDGSSVGDRLDGSGGGERGTGDDVVEVSKHRFCETCPHFSAPPDVSCGHRGTDVLEFVGTDEVRVSNCPVVRQRRELGEVHE